MNTKLYVLYRIVPRSMTLCDPEPQFQGHSIVYRAVKCRLIWHFRGQALLLRALHVVASDNVRDCVFLKDDLNRVKKGLNSYE